VFVHVSSATSRIAISWVVDIDTAYPALRWIGATRYRSSAIPGRSAPRYLAKPTETAAIVPVWITRKSVQPYRKPHSGENASRR
jgi:hypothetical protein